MGKLHPGGLSRISVVKELTVMTSAVYRGSKASKQTKVFAMSLNLFLMNMPYSLRLTFCRVYILHTMKRDTMIVCKIDFKMYFYHKETKTLNRREHILSHVDWLF